MGTLAPVPRLRGRGTEIRVLREALDRVCAGRQAIVLIEGEAGIGKTRLLEQALEEARGRGMQVAAGRAEELEQTRPFGVVAAAFGCTVSSPDPRRAAIAGLLASRGNGGRGPVTVTSDPGLQFRVVDAITDLAEELALGQPLVIGADDLQWADPSSLVTLAVAGRRLGDVPVALFGCYRPAPHTPELERLAGALEAAGARRLGLGPLTDVAVRDLAAESVAADPGPALLAGLAGAAGNPLFVIELLGALIQEGALEIADNRAEVGRVVLPPTLRLTILRRLSFLPETTLQALRTASILGSVFSLTDLAIVTGRPAVALSVALAEAIRAGVLADDGARLRFRHDLIRDALYEDLPGSVRRGLHREAGQRLARSAAPAPQVAGHLARAATAGDAEAIGWLTRAAREAAGTSPAVAADLLGQAIVLMDRADPGRDRLLPEQALSLLRAGRLLDSEKICRDLLGRAHDPAAEGPARLCLGYALAASGRPRDGLEQQERVSGSPLLTSAERASARAWAGNGRVDLGDLDGAAAAAREALAIEQADNPLATSTAMATLAQVSERRGHLPEALEIIDNAVHLADHSPGRAGHRYSLHLPRAFILIGLDRLDEARSAIETGRRISEDLGIRWHLPNYPMVRAAERFIAGEWDDAIAEAEATIDLADEMGKVPGLILAQSVLALISLHRNDLTRASEAVGAALRQLEQTGSRYRAQWAPWAQALLLEAEGKPAEALVVLADLWDWCTRSGFTLECRAFGADLVRLALARGERGRAREVAAAVVEIAEQNEISTLTGAALHCRGLADNDAEVLQAAADAYRRGPRPLELARACEDAGAAFARQDDPARARPLLEQAVTIYENLEAARDLGRTEALLRAAGIRRGRHGPRRRPQFGWLSLTPTEQAVAGLVADGLTNPQIGDRLYVSRRTVQTHLAHVFTKLDIASRAQLAAEVARWRETSSGDRLPRGTRP
jgi:DNA-binding CsgD family transcriptional regulator/tetratricopeptide (TPR) repeat protein